MTAADHQVIVVGGGPVGLTLAIDLGQRGVECLLIDKRPAPGFLPKMERCHTRTMEHFRRLGIVQQVRDAGYPADLPLDVMLVTSLVDAPLMHYKRPSSAEMRRQIETCVDGSLPLEPYQIISQYTLEPLLKRVAEQTHGVTVQFGTELVALTEHGDHVTVTVRGDDGTERSLTASYLAGCDGASSIVRKEVGFELEGDSNIGNQMQALFYCEDLFERIPIGKACHYHLADDRWTFMIVQDDTKHFTLHAMVQDPDEMPARFERMVGMDINYETLYVGPWTMRLMLADHYASERVFLAGDAAHLVTPIGGFGMNTGIGDAIDLAWKLDGAVHGWAGPSLLASYEAERRLVGRRNVDAATNSYRLRRQWRDMLADAHRDEPAESRDEALSGVGTAAATLHARQTNVAGIVSGYRYLDSPIIAHEPGDDGEDQKSYDYEPTTLPGARLPHTWLSDGSPIQDRIGRGYTCVHFGIPTDHLQPLAEAFSEFSCPLEFLDVSDSQDAHDVYESNVLLLRPDMHVAWRGDGAPNQPRSLAALVTGHSRT